MTSRSFSSLVTFIVALVALTSLVDACSCAPGTFRTYFKGATLVVKVKVISAKTSPTPKPIPCIPGEPCSIPFFGNVGTEFKLKVLQRYKGCGPKPRIFKGRSVLSGSFCGIFLVPGKVYLLYLNKGTREPRGMLSFGLSACQGIRQFSTLSRLDRRFLSRRARKNLSRC